MKQTWPSMRLSAEALHRVSTRMLVALQKEKERMFQRNLALSRLPLPGLALQKNEKGIVYQCLAFSRLPSPGVALQKKARRIV
eukprot:2464637-Karenia_brevis.AAC.1